MTPDEEIECLDSQITRLMETHPGVWGILRISPTAFRVCTESRWQTHGWSIRDEEVAKILNGGDQERREGLLSLLKAHYVHKVEFVPGVDIIEIVPDETVQDQV